MDFVFISLQRIGANRESTSTQLARELARQGHRVLYINSPLDRKDQFRSSPDPLVRAHAELLRAGAPQLREMSSRLWVYYPRHYMDSFNWVSSTSVFSQLIKVNNKRLAEDIKEATQQLGFTEYIFINDKCIYRGFYLKELLQPSQYIYLDRDYTLGTTYWKRHGTVLEPALMHKADAVLCNSPDFAAWARRSNPHSYYIGNGFDKQLFAGASNAALPKELAELPPGPRIGYVGALITLRLDLPLLTQLAKRNPSWQFVFIGWEDAEFAASLLHQLPNVHFLGSLPYHEVPAYMRHFDVCINPQLLSLITVSNFPLKILEYLALGRPVVATSTNFMREAFSEHTYLATSALSFETHIRRALSEDCAEKQEDRLHFVAQFSWTHVAEKLLDAVYELQEARLPLGELHAAPLGTDSAADLLSVA